MNHERQEAVLRWVRSVTGAAEARWAGELQSLWRGYGAIARVTLIGAAIPSVVVKVVDPPPTPRDADEAFAHRRKLRSYQVETAWYRDRQELLTPGLRLPAYVSHHQDGDRLLLALEDLDAAGFPGRRRHLSRDELHACLGWLARFHAASLGASTDGLWPTGSYWHLATRPAELRATTDAALREAAPLIDARLSAARYQGLIHGDTKAANFCFGEGRSPVRVAAVDFQYVGGGCGVKDVACFLSYRGARESVMRGHLDAYFAALREALAARGVDPAPVEAEWRALYPLAWADYHRFLAGWAPTHWKLTVGYGRRLVREALAAL